MLRNIIVLSERFEKEERNIFICMFRKYFVILRCFNIIIKNIVYYTKPTEH